MRTPLYAIHCRLGARIVDFNGWEMPLQYTGILEEHRAVRSAAGLFDVSHMGRVLFQGPDAEPFADYISTNKIAGKKEGTATYTVFANEKGGSVDDALLYKESATSFFTVVNAGNRQKDLIHFHKAAANFDVAIADRYAGEGLLALQGPKALALICDLFPETAKLEPFHFIPVAFNGANIILSRTGYTGEKGVEIIAPLDAIPPLWELLMKRGEPYGIRPIGLGARDTLRLEMGYALYGHELSEEISPIESVSSWTVKFKERNFIGKEAILTLKESGSKRCAGALILEEKGIAREGYPLYRGETQIGAITSGTLSPSCGKAIALFLADRELLAGEELYVEIRSRRCRAIVASLPFYKNSRIA